MILHWILKKNLYFRKVLDLQKNYKNSTEFPYAHIQFPSFVDNIRSLIMTSGSIYDNVII